VSYLIKEQFYNFTPRKKTVEDSFPKKVEYTLYMLSLKEWNLESIVYTLLWKPFKQLWQKIEILDRQKCDIYLHTYIFIRVIWVILRRSISLFIFKVICLILFAMMGLMMVLKCLYGKKKCLTKLDSHYYQSLLCGNCSSV